MQRIKAFIVDDSLQARNLLNMMLIESGFAVEVIGEAPNVDIALNALKTDCADLVFLDIDMPGKSGLDLPTLLRQNGLNPVIVFVTAYQEHALRAFDLAAVDYLLKPLNIARLKECLKRVVSLYEKADDTANSNKLTAQNIITIQSQKEAIVVALTDIMYLEASGSYTTFLTITKKQILTTRNLKFFEKIITEKSSEFMRVHRSYFVNVKCIHKIKNDVLELSNGKEIPVARDKRKALLLLMK